MEKNIYEVAKNLIECSKNLKDIDTMASDICLTISKQLVERLAQSAKNTKVESNETMQDTTTVKQTESDFHSWKKTPDPKKESYDETEISEIAYLINNDVKAAEKPISSNESVFEHVGRNNKNGNTPKNLSGSTFHNLPDNEKSKIMETVDRLISGGK